MAESMIQLDTMPLWGNAGSSPARLFNLSLSTFSESNTMNNLPLTINGIPNIQNNLVLASMLDIVGLHLTNIMNNLGAQEGVMEIEDMRDMIAVHGLLQELRHCIPISQTPNQARNISKQICAELATHQESNREALERETAELREFARTIGQEASVDAYLASMGIRPTASDAADDILRDLRESGTIGGSRAV